MKVYKDLWWFFKKEKTGYLFGILMLVLVALMELIPPQVIGRVIDSISADTLTPRNLTVFLAVLVVAAILTYIFRYFWRVLIFGASNRLGKIMRERLFRKYAKMSPSFYQEMRTGDLMAHATNDSRGGYFSDCRFFNYRRRCPDYDGCDHQSETDINRHDSTPVNGSSDQLLRKAFEQRL